MAAFTLRYRTRDGQLHAIDLSVLNEPLVVGRDKSSARLVLADVHISRAHCAIKREAGGFVLEDLGSRNGTWVNHERIQKVVLSPKDIISIGTTDLWLETPGEAELLVGKTMGGFEVQDVLGRGNYGTVYKGLQVALRRQVAIKVLDPRHKEDPEVIRNFLEEARRAGRLNHPNVVQVHDVLQCEGNYLLVMELMTGGSVANHLRSRGALGQQEALHILRDIGRALAYAESQGLVHRDVKPDNILVNEERIYKLADLGIAAPITEDGSAHQIKIFGSVHYVAPEQARGGAIDGRADIYALGATVYHLLSGRTLFEGTAREIVAAHQRQDPRPLSELVPGLNTELALLVAEMLAKDAEARIASGRIVAERAMSLLEQFGEAPVPGAPRPGTRRLRLARGRVGHGRGAEGPQRGGRQARAGRSVRRGRRRR